MLNPTVIELGSADSVVITRNGKVVGFVEVKRDARENFIELLANPVAVYDNWFKPDAERVSHSFATTGATEVASVEDLASAENFIRFMTKVSA
jgi:hypothetical protein